MINNSLTDYIKATLDIKTELNPLDNKSNLPLFLRTGYDLYTCNIFNHNFLIAQAPINNDTTPAYFRKHLELDEKNLFVDFRRTQGYFTCSVD